MKQRKKRLILLISCMIVCCLSSCNGRENEQKTVESEMQIDKEHVYKETVLEDYMSKMGVTDISNVIVKNGRFYIAGSYSANDGTYSGDIYASINVDGTDEKSFSLQTLVVVGEEEKITEEERITKEENLNEEKNVTEEDTEIEQSTTEESVMYSAMAVNSEGNFVLLKNRYVYNNSDYTSKNNYSIVVYSQDGNLLAEKEITPESDEESEDYYITNLVLSDTDDIYTIESNKIVKYNKEVKREKTYDIKNLGYVNDILIKNNIVHVIGWDESLSKQYLWTLDSESNEFSSQSLIPESGTLIPGDDEYDFYLYTDTEIKGWKKGEEGTTLIMNFIDSNVSLSYAYKLLREKDKFYILYADIVDYKTSFSELTKVNPEDVIEKQIMSLGCYYLDYQMKKQIIQFNKKSEKYHIKVTDYSQYNTDEDYTIGLSKMNLDITSGKVPDIIILNENMPLDNYIQKGVLEDLTPMMKKNGIDISQYAPNVIKAYSKDEKLYCLVPSFYIQTYVGKESIVGKKENWNIKDATNLMKAYDGKGALFDRKSKMDILVEGMNYMGNNLIDMERGTCKFNTEEFMEFLEFVNLFPQDVPEMDEEFWNNYETLYRDNRALLMDIYIGSIRDFNYLEKGRMGEKVSFVGFPNSEGEGALIIPSTQISISKSSKLKDEAFEFISYFLSDEYQNSSELYNLPISLNALKKQMKDAQKKYTYLDENGNEVEYDEYYYFNGGEEVITPIEENRAKEVLKYICSVEQRKELDSKVMEIVTEEASAYFAGAKTVEETANLIQNRVQIYINENR